MGNQKTPPAPPNPHKPQGPNRTTPELLETFGSDHLLQKYKVKLGAEGEKEEITISTWNVLSQCAAGYQENASGTNGTARKQSGFLAPDFVGNGWKASNNPFNYDEHTTEYEKRLKLIAQKIRESKSDVICLQECDEEMAAKIATNLGDDYAFKGSHKVDGEGNEIKGVKSLATFYRRSKVEVVSSNPSFQESGKTGNKTFGLTTVFKSKSTATEFVVQNVHVGLINAADKIKKNFLALQNAHSNLPIFSLGDHNNDASVLKSGQSPFHVISSDKATNFDAAMIAGYEALSPEVKQTTGEEALANLSANQRFLLEAKKKSLHKKPDSAANLENKCYDFLSTNIDEEDVVATHAYFKNTKCKVGNVSSAMVEISTQPNLQNTKKPKTPAPQPNPSKHEDKDAKKQKKAQNAFQRAVKKVFAEGHAGPEERARLRNDLANKALPQSMADILTNSSEQFDGAEFTTFFLDAVTPEENKFEETSEVLCGKRSHKKTESHTKLELPLRRNAGSKNAGSKNTDPIKCSEMLGVYCETENLEGDNQFGVENGLKVDATKRLIPRVKKHDVDIVVSLKRFASESDKKKQPKQIRLNDPVELDIIEFSDLKGDSQKYEATSFIVHRGNMDYGHYVTYVKEQRAENDAIWVCYDDSSRDELSEDLPPEASQAYTIKFSPLAKNYESKTGAARYKTELPGSQGYGTSNRGVRCWANAAFAFGLSITSLHHQSAVLDENTTENFADVEAEETYENIVRAAKTTEDFVYDAISNDNPVFLKDILTHTKKDKDFLVDALCHATLNGKSKTADFLKEFGADPKRKSKLYNTTAEEIANPPIPQPPSPSPAAKSAEQFGRLIEVKASQETCWAKDVRQNNFRLNKPNKSAAITDQTTAELTMVSILINLMNDDTTKSKNKGNALTPDQLLAIINFAQKKGGVSHKKNGKNESPIYLKQEAEAFAELENAGVTKDLAKYISAAYQRKCLDADILSGRKNLKKEVGSRLTFLTPKALNMLKKELSNDGLKNDFSSFRLVTESTNILNKRDEDTFSVASRGSSR